MTANSETPGGKHEVDRWTGLISHQVATAWIRAKRAIPADLRVRARTASFRSIRLGRAWWSIDPQNRWNKIDTNTSLVIDGFPRSANTYASTAFKLANPTTQVRAFLHTPIAIREAHRLGIPAILLLRPPEDAVPSYLQMLPGLTPHVAIAMYVQYYSSIEDLLDWCVIALFDETVSDFGHVISRCNERFNTTFEEYEPTSANELRVRQIITEQWSGHYATPLPSQARLTGRQVLAGFDEADHRRLRTATEIYNRVRARRA